MLQGQELRKRTIEIMHSHPYQTTEGMIRAIKNMTGDLLAESHVRDELRTLVRLRWERPRNDSKIAEMMELDVKHIEILTRSNGYTYAMEKYLVHITVDVDEGRKMQNYVRTALRRGACPAEAFAKKMRITNVDESASILETLSCYVMLPEFDYEYTDEEDE